MNTLDKTEHIYQPKLSQFLGYHQYLKRFKSLFGHLNFWVETKSRLHVD